MITIEEMNLNVIKKTTINLKLLVYKGTRVYFHTEPNHWVRETEGHAPQVQIYSGMALLSLNKNKVLTLKTYNYILYKITFITIT